MSFARLEGIGIDAVADQFLLQSQQNDVFRAIQEAGLNPAEFDWVTMRTEATQIGPGGERIDVPALMHHDAGAYFKFDMNLNRTPPQAVSFYTPGYDSPRDLRVTSSWADQLGYVRSWLEYLKREYHGPDLWAELHAQRELLTGLAEAAESNAPFSADEQAEIARKLNEAKIYVRRTRELTAAQYEAIESRLDYLVEAAGRQGRLDWRNTFIGALVGAVIQAELPPEPVQDALNLALRGLSHLFGVHIPELPR